jgi:hypothetical protein
MLNYCVQTAKSRRIARVGSMEKEVWSRRQGPSARRLADVKHELHPLSNDWPYARAGLFLDLIIIDVVQLGASNFLLSANSFSKKHLVARVPCIHRTLAHLAYCATLIVGSSRYLRAVHGYNYSQKR